MSIQLRGPFGEWLRAEVVEPHGLTVTGAAGKLHVTRQVMSNLLVGRGELLVAMEIRFEKASGLKADTLMRVQTAYGLAEARPRENEIGVEPALLLKAGRTVLCW